MMYITILIFQYSHLPAFCNLIWILRALKTSLPCTMKLFNSSVQFIYGHSQNRRLFYAKYIFCKQQPLNTLSNSISPLKLKFLFYSA